ncbi:hypothetical protein RLJV_23435 [Pseudomonas aeruginosa]|nr:hypothetical protein RLJV_23435 [Pseudomonas aeruginosa]
MAVEAFAELVAALEDPACQLRIKLEPGEILVQFVAVVLPILICTGIGFAWSRSAGPVDTRALVFLVANVGFPCLLLSSHAAELREHGHPHRLPGLRRGGAGVCGGVLHPDPGGSRDARRLVRFGRCW